MTVNTHHTAAPTVVHVQPHESHMVAAGGARGDGDVVVSAPIGEAVDGDDANGKPESSKRQGGRGHLRQAGGSRWVDNTLDDWPTDDFRIFVGNLGWDVTDDILAKAFQTKYSSFQRARVVRDGKSNKVKGYGFVSFSDFVEGAKALKEMDGKYVGNRTVKLSKSTWKAREASSSAAAHRRGAENGGGGGGGVGGVRDMHIKKKMKRNYKLKHLPII